MLGTVAALQMAGRRQLGPAQNAAAEAQPTEGFAQRIGRVGDANSINHDERVAVQKAKIKGAEISDE